MDSMTLSMICEYDPYIKNVLVVLVLFIFS